jgi:DMSO/TMAO reductase YedYZ heme-binding membrane subunit
VRRQIRVAWQVGLVALGLVAIVIPPLVVGRSGTASADPLWTTLRLAALEAFTLVTANLIVGAFRPLLNRVAKARTMQRVHVTIDLTGFSLALAHGIMVLIFGVSGYSKPQWLVGPTVLALLLLVILTALTRRRLRRSWRWIHRLNYVIFFAAFAHGLLLGYDVRNGALLKVWFGVWAAVAIVGLAYRLRAMVKPRGARA